MPQPKNENGFTLIEVLVGLIILAVGLLALASLQVTSIRGNAYSGNIMQATYVSQDGLESLKILPFDDASLNEGNYKDKTVTVLDNGYSTT